MPVFQHDATPGNTGQNPVVAEVTRGNTVESVHRGAFAVVNTEGRAVLAAGDIEQPIFPRSAVKPIQALPLIESGAADAYALYAAQLALACASHNGEPDHVAAVEAWLARIGCGESDLVCGGNPPLAEAARESFYRRNESLRPVSDNCSGKHTGFLTLARHLDAPTAGYNTLTHAVQQRILGTLEAMSGLEGLDRQPHGRDGCGIPAFTLPLGNIALAMARFGDPEDQPESRQAACARLRASMAAHPWMVAGTGRFCTDAMTALQGRVLVKIGAEGVCVASLPALGLGLVVKIDDGAARAAPVVVGALLRKLEVLDDAAVASLKPHIAPELQDRTPSRAVVGALRPNAAIF